MTVKRFQITTAIEESLEKFEGISKRSDAGKKKDFSSLEQMFIRIETFIPLPLQA